MTIPGYLPAHIRLLLQPLLQRCYFPVEGRDWDSVHTGREQLGNTMNISLLIVETVDRKIIKDIENLHNTINQL